MKPDARTAREPWVSLETMVCNLLERAGAGKSETRETLFTLHALFAQVERLEQERDETRDGLVTLRGAWNAHMARCDLDAERQAEINRFVPTFEQIQAWANAPSNTASAETPEGEGR